MLNNNTQDSTESHHRKGVAYESCRRSRGTRTEIISKFTVFSISADTQKVLYSIL